MECPELDKFVKEYNEKEFDLFMLAGVKFEKFNVCRIKQEYHIPGNLFIYYKEEENGKDYKEIKNIIIYFYSSFSCDKGNVSKCNKNNDKDNLCYGSLFRCLPKENNRIIKIEVKDIRMIIKRIYFYRKSGLEIFTSSKSYYFNFFSEEDFNNFFCYFIAYFEDSYFPININKNIIGYIKLNNREKVLNNLTKSFKKNDFIKFITNKTSSGEICEMSNFDLILLINLISNRSYIDLNQYPIFPMIYFYDKNNKIIKRDFKEHIGFQSETDLQKRRKEIIIEAYKSNKEDEDIEENGLFYFNSHYSNIVYTSNFMIRLFPYSFLYIELIGDGFDNPNRLFSSIEDTFYNISVQKSDLRELIPEFFYLPEMFMNINSIYFGKQLNDLSVDNVIMPGLGDNRIENDNILKSFFFVDSIKSKLELINSQKLNSWFDLIFGEHQRYKSKSNERHQYFRNLSYIDIDKKTYLLYSRDDIIMDSVEFGLIPLQTIYNNKISTNREINYDNKMGKEKNINIRNYNIENNNITYNIIIYKSYKMNNPNYWKENIDIGFRIDKNNNFGKIEVIIKNSLIDTIMDHNDKIIDIFYNQRLNMFATTSLDGFVFIYILPNKLFSAIKHPNNLYFTNIFLISNPFPAIITYDNNNNKNIFRSYSLSGIFIK